MRTSRPDDVPPRPRTTLSSTFAAAVLALGATGCGTRSTDSPFVPDVSRTGAPRSGVPRSDVAPSDAPRLTRTVPSSLRSVGPRPSRPVDGRSRYVHVPSVLGQTVAAARLRIGVHRFRQEEGRRFVLASQTSMLARMVPDEAGARIVTSQLPRRPDIAEYGEPVVLGTEPPAAPDRRPLLREAPWTIVRWAAGTLVLDGLQLRGSCDRIDHVQLGPRGGATRFARVWIQTLSSPPPGGCPRRTPQAVLLRPGADWTRDTVAWNTPLAPARDDLDEVRRVRYADVTVQPDAQTIMVGVPNRGCEVPAGVTITLRGRVATVDARVGTAPRPADADPGPRPCPSDLRESTVMVRLPRPLPFGTTFAARG